MAADVVLADDGISLFHDDFPVTPEDGSEWFIAPITCLLGEIDCTSHELAFVHARSDTATIHQFRVNAQLPLAK